MYCPHCGKEVVSDAVVCVSCGRSLQTTARPIRPANVSPKSRLVAALLAWFVGVFGIHRFYIGKTGTAVLMLLTFGGFGLWVLIDFIMIIAGSMRDIDGLLITDWNLD